MSKINFRNLKLKSHEEYMSCLVKVEKGERNDKMPRKSKSKAYFRVDKKQFWEIL